MKMILYIALGGAIGSVARHMVGKGVMALLGSGFPYWTLLINIVGSFAMGIIVELLGTHISVSQEARAFMTVGILGGFTTFSSFSLDAVTLWERGEMASAILYVALSVFVSLAALFAGLFLVRSFST